MSSSAETSISLMMEEIRIRNPKYVLDVGIGFGKFGFLCREYLESWKNRTYPEQWVVIIDGVEIWKPFIDKLPWNKILYNKIYNEDIYKIIDTLPNYDLIIAGDIIEHLSKEKGTEIIKKLIKKSRCLLVSIPIGNWLSVGTLDGNPYEKHQAIWEISDLIKLGKEQLGYNIKIRIWNGTRKRIGCVAVFDKIKKI